jgi:putative ABC transport system permease protein
MRRLRALQPEQQDDFALNEQSAIRGPVDKLKGGISIAGFFITGLALFVGAIGIMNITYVSVKERTREIGTRKALGARRTTILMQFLIEAVTICVIGGGVGVAITGVLFPIAAAQVSAIPLVFPISLVGVALGVSFLFGILSGFLPALQASGLNPVEALRYE